METRQINTPADYRRALREVEGLMSARFGTPEGDRLDALAKLVEKWEEREYRFEASGPTRF